MSAPMQSSIAANELATLLIPVNGKQLVLPNVTVAEIIPFMSPQLDREAPDWYLGAFSWRNIEVPLISFETINEETTGQETSSRRIAVLNGLLNDERLPFCGIVTEGVPRLMRIMPDEISSDEEMVSGPAELARVLVSGEHAAIPNVDYIQQKVLEII